MTLKFIKETNSLPKMTKDTAILLHDTSNNCLVSRGHIYIISSSKKRHARTIKIHQKHFKESIPYEDVNPDHFRQRNYNFRNIHIVEKKLTRFQSYPETELACNYNKPLYKTQYSEILVKYEQGFDMNAGNLIIHPTATHHSTSDEIQISQ